MAVTPAKLPTNADEVVDKKRFFERVVPLYEQGIADIELEADFDAARATIPAATGAPRDFSFIAPEIPEFIAENCVGCMDCVTECPDTAILAKIMPKEKLEGNLSSMTDERRKNIEPEWAHTRKYWNAPEKQGKEPGYFGIFIDPTKCKGCAECVQVCDDDALKMIKKTDTNMPQIADKWEYFKEAPPTPETYINEKVLADMMLRDDTLQYVGGAGSCAGCGEAL